MLGKLRKADGDELSAAGLVLGLLFLVPGALVLAIPPLLAASSRIGYQGTALFLLGIVVLSIAFFVAYERLKPSSPPTPRRDLVVILFSALLAGLWIYLFTNALTAFLVVGGLGAIVLLPDDFVQRFTDHLPMQGTGGGSTARSPSRRRSPPRSPVDEAARAEVDRRHRRARAVGIVAGIVSVVLLTVLHFGPHCLIWTRQSEFPGTAFDCSDLVPSGALYPSFEPYYLLVGIAVGVVTYYVALALANRSATSSLAGAAPPSSSRRTGGGRPAPWIQLGNIRLEPEIAPIGAFRLRLSHLVNGIAPEAASW